MELNLPCLYGLLWTALLISWDPATTPPPALGLKYEVTSNNFILNFFRAERCQFYKYSAHWCQTDSSLQEVGIVLSVSALYIFKVLHFSQRFLIVQLFFCCVAKKTLQMKGRWESSVNVWFRFTYSQKYFQQNYNLLSPSSRISLPILLQGNMWTDPGNI